MGFITMGGVFAANMTGNTVLAGIEAAQGKLLATWQHLAPLVAFFAGAMLARLMLRLLRTPKASLVLEAAILAVVGFLSVDREIAVLIVALAMGVQASAITQFGGSAVSTVVVTSTLARAADATLDRIWPRAAPHLSAIANPRLLLLTWLGYLAGAIIGASLLPVLAWPLLVPAALLLVLLLVV